MTIAIYAGTFDPFTLGHEDVVARASKIFDHVIVAVAKDCGRNTFFSFEERVQLAQSVTSDFGNVSVEGFSGLLSHFVASKGAAVIVRGVRNASDFDYEARMAMANHALDHNIQTVFIPPLSSTQSISGSLVREIMKLGGDVSHFVNPIILNALKAKSEQLNQ